MNKKINGMYTRILYICVVASFGLGVIAGMLFTAHTYDEAFESGYYMVSETAT